MELLKRAAEKTDAAELYMEHREGTSVTFNTGDLESVKSESVVGQALRVIVGGKLGFAATTGPKGDGLLEAAMASAQHGDQAPFAFTATEDGTPVDVYDEQAVGLSEDTLIGWATEAMAAVKEAFPEVHTNAALRRGRVEVSVGNTAAPVRTERRSHLSMSVDAEWVREEDIYAVGAGQAVRKLTDLDRERLVADVLRQLEWGRDVAPTPTGTQPVLFLPAGSLAVLLPLFIGFSGMSVFLGTSPLKDRLGEQVFDRRFVLTDDGRIPLGPRSSSFDDEGIPTTKLPLVEAGVLRNYFYDLRSAALADTEPTGNGFKGGVLGGGFRTPPSPNPRHLALQPGEGSVDDLIREMGEGLIVQNALGLGQGNIASGAFSNNVVGYAVRGGKVVGRVKNTMIAGNAYELLKGGLKALGGEPEWVFGVLHAPPILLEGVSVVTQ